MKNCDPLVSGPAVRVGEAAGTIELQVRRRLVLELVARIADAVAGGVSALNHEFRDHAMKDGAVVKGTPCFFRVGNGVGPVLGALGQADEVGNADGGLFLKQLAVHVAGSGVDDGGWIAGWRCCGDWRSNRRLRRRCGLAEASREAGSDQNENREEGSHRHSLECVGQPMIVSRLGLMAGRLAPTSVALPRTGCGCLELATAGLRLHFAAYAFGFAEDAHQIAA